MLDKYHLQAVNTSACMPSSKHQQAPEFKVWRQRRVDGKPCCSVAYLPHCSYLQLHSTCLTYKSSLCCPAEIFSLLKSFLLQSQVRYRDGQVVTAKGEKYVVEKVGQDWDGGSKGKVFTKGKRGKGTV